MKPVDPSTASASDSRYASMSQWVSTCLASRLPDGDLKLSAVSGDAGFRSYHRVEGVVPACIVVDAPPETENNQAFCHVAKLLRQYGIHAPQIYAVDYEQGFLLIEDLGAELYLPGLQDPLKLAAQQLIPTPPLYRDAEAVLIKLAQIPTEGVGLERYDETKLQMEMDLFLDWFVAQLLQVEVDKNIEQGMQPVYSQLISNAFAQPQVVVHRDFHSRNLLQIENNNPGVIDFQDAVIGPLTYDLVSLYRDCYIQWPGEQVTQWVLDFSQNLARIGLIQSISDEEFMRWFDWMGLQRHIKVLGIFSRLYLRDNKPAYLRDLPLVIHYTLSVAKKYSEFADFTRWFEDELLIRARSQDWYREISE